MKASLKHCSEFKLQPTDQEAKASSLCPDLNTATNRLLRAKAKMISSRKSLTHRCHPVYWAPGGRAGQKSWFCTHVHPVRDAGCYVLITHDLPLTTTMSIWTEMVKSFRNTNKAMFTVRYTLFIFLTINVSTGVWEQRSQVYFS